MVIDWIVPDPDLKSLLEMLRAVHLYNCEQYSIKHGRWPTFGDQLEKHAEEIGEYVKAKNGKNPEPPLNELWDCVFSLLATVLNPFDNLRFSDKEIIQAYWETLDKIATRAGI